MTNRESKYHKWNRWVKKNHYVKEVHNGYTFTSTTFPAPKGKCPIGSGTFWCMNTLTIIKYNNVAR